MGFIGLRVAFSLHKIGYFRNNHHAQALYHSQSTMNELSQLKWRSRRGMKELDVLLAGYLEFRYDQAPVSERQAFKALLERPNTDLYAYLIGQKIPTDGEMLNVVRSIKHFAQSSCDSG